MNLPRLVLLRGIYRNAKFLFNPPSKTQKIIFVSETGLISQELLPIHTGFIVAEAIKKAWLVIHSLKFAVRKNGEFTGAEPVLLVSERSYRPLDPNGRLSKRDKEKMMSLNDIARLRHADARSEVGNGKNEQEDITRIIVTGCFILIGIFAVVKLIENWRG